jgi:6-pyruvoyltetrahydropterin/6-carboxytetrahydropterin synthase
MYTITKTFSFSATRQLSGFPVDHPKTMVNDITLDITFKLTSVCLNQDGFIIDTDKLVCIETFIGMELNKKYINNVFQFNPTNENIAKFFFKKYKKQFHNISAVVVKEMPGNTTAKYILSHDEEDHIEIVITPHTIEEDFIKFPLSGTQKKHKKKGFSLL